MKRNTFCYLVLFCIVCLVSCRQKLKNRIIDSDKGTEQLEQTDSNENLNNRSKNTLTEKDSLTQLPFDLVEWIQSQIVADLTDAYEGRYLDFDFSNNKKLESICETLISGDTLLSKYYILDNNRENFNTYLLVLGIQNSSDIYYKIVNIRDNKILSSLLVGGLPDSKTERMPFIISEKLKITLYYEKINPEPDMEIEEDEAFDVEVLSRTILGIYQIEEDGSITKLE